MRGDLLGSMGKQHAKNITARRIPSRGARSEFAQSLRSFAGSLPARRGARSEFAQSLCSFAGSLPARRGGPCKTVVPSRSCAARRAAIAFCGPGPFESKLSPAWPPKRNQNRFRDADSLIMNVLRRDRDYVVGAIHI